MSIRLQLWEHFGPLWQSSQIFARNRLQKHFWSYSLSMASSSQYHPEHILVVSKPPSRNELLSGMDVCATRRLAHLAWSFSLWGKAMSKSTVRDTTFRRYWGGDGASMLGIERQASSSSRPYHSPRLASSGWTGRFGWRDRVDGLWLLDSATHQRFVEKREKNTSAPCVIWLIE